MHTNSLFNFPFILLFYWSLKKSEIFGYGYIFRGLWSTYLRFEKSAQVDDARFFFNDTITKSFHPFRINEIGIFFYSNHSYGHRMQSFLKEKRS